MNRSPTPTPISANPTIRAPHAAEARLKSLRVVRERLYGAKSVKSPRGKVLELSPQAMSTAEGAAIVSLARAERALTALETGFAFGLSTSFLFEGLLENYLAIDPEDELPQAVHVTSVDPFQTRDWDGVGMAHMNDAGLSGLHTLIDSDSRYALPALAGKGLRYDLVFIDGDHRFDGVFMDLLNACRLVKPTGLIVMDDAWMPSVKKAIAFAVNNGVCVRDPRPHGPGNESSAFKRFALLRPAPEAAARKWDHFVDF